MSDIIEKTIAALPKFFSEGLLGTQGEKCPSPKKLTGHGYQNFIRAVCRSRSKREEGQIINYELEQLKVKDKKGITSQDVMCDCVCRLIFSHMLGYDVSFGCVNALKLAAQWDGIQRRVGYIGCYLLLQGNSELLLLLTSTMVKDLKSSSMLEQCMSLSGLCHLMSADVIVQCGLIEMVQSELRHQRELARLKAGCFVYHVIRIMPSYIPLLEDDISRLFCDKDPGVMAVAVQIYLHLLRKGVNVPETLTTSLVSILQQIMNRSLPSSFEYHGIPLPWLQIDILRALALLGKGNTSNSEQMYSCLRDVLDKTNMKERMAYAIMYECIVTITVICVNRELLQEAGQRVKKFVTSSSYTLKYIGVKALTQLLKACPESSGDFQMVVVELLDDPDLSIQSKTVELLYSIATDKNAKFVCERLLDHLKRPIGDFHKTELTHKIISLIHKFGQSEMWGIDKMMQLLETKQTFLPKDIVERFIDIIQKVIEPSPDERQKKEDIQYIIKKSIKCLMGSDCPGELIQISTWVIGECSVMLRNLPEDKIISLMQKHFTRATIDVSTKLWILSCVMKLVSGNVLHSESTLSVLEDMSHSVDHDSLKLKLEECKQLCKLGQIPKVNISGKQTAQDQMDFTLSFLDGYVLDALEKGDEPYKVKSIRHPQVLDSQSAMLFAGLTETKDRTGSILSSTSSKDDRTSGSCKESNKSSESRGVELRLEGVKRVWGPEGYMTVQEPSQMTEDDKTMSKKQELAAALFSGESVNQQSKVVEDDWTEDMWLQDIPLDLSDTSSTNWRQVSKQTREDSTHAELRTKDDQESRNPLQQIKDDSARQDILKQDTTGLQAADSTVSYDSVLQDPPDNISLSCYHEDTQRSDEMIAGIHSHQTESESMSFDLFSSSKQTERLQSACSDGELSQNALHLDTHTDLLSSLDLTSSGEKFEQKSHEKEQFSGDNLYAEYSNISDKDDISELNLEDDQPKSLYDDQPKSLYDEFQ